MVQWIRWLENEGGYRWFDPFGSPKTNLFDVPFIHAFCKTLSVSC